jgi:hypothetical protein
MDRWNKNLKSNSKIGITIQNSTQVICKYVKFMLLQNSPYKQHQNHLSQADYHDESPW